MTTLTCNLQRSIPVIAEADVVVVGGGPGGIGAAVMAARTGADTVLVERYGFLGGMASAGEVTPFMPSHIEGSTLDRPVYVEWVRRMHEYLPEDVRAAIPFDDGIANRDLRMISKDTVMLAAEDLCRAAGVRLLYHHWVSDVVMDGRRIGGAVFISKSGHVAVSASCYVDCTGDGDLAVMAGCEYEQGGPSGHSQPMTLCFKLSHVDRSRVPEQKEWNRLYQEAKDRGDIHCPREDVLHFTFFDDDVMHFNTTRVIQKSGTNGVELSEAEQEGRQQVREYLTFLRARVSGFERARIHSIAHHIGVRETRRIKGLQYLTRETFDKAGKFADGVVRCRYGIDIHNPDGTGTEHGRLPEGEYYEIPYGCIVPKDVDNLTVGGRPISVDHALHSSMRVMPTACSVGQAAGMAAALSAQRHCRPANLDGKEIRALLREKGARL